MIIFTAANTKAASDTTSITVGPAVDHPPVVTAPVSVNASAGFSLRINVTATDPMTLIAVAVMLAGVAALASWIPARRAMAVSPTEALRGGG